MQRKVFSIQLHNDHGLFGVNGSGYDERKNFVMTAIFIAKREAVMKQGHEFALTVSYRNIGDCCLPDISILQNGAVAI